MTITMQTDHEGTYVFITADGEKIPRGFTPETDRYQVAKFLALLNEHEQEITEMTGEYWDKLALLWQILLNGKVIGFPNQFLNDS